MIVVVGCCWVGEWQKKERYMDGVLFAADVKHKGEQRSDRGR